MGQAEYAQGFEVYVPDMVYDELNNSNINIHDD